MQLTVVAFVALTAAAPSFAQEARFHPIGLVPDGFSSHAWGVSADGSVVVGEASDGSDDRTARWTAESGLVILTGPYDSGMDVSALGVSADGTVIVGSSSDPEFSFPFVWSEAGGWGSIPTSFDQYVNAFDASADGVTVVGAGTSYFGPSGAFRWTAAGGTEELGNLGGPFESSGARAVSNDGDIVVGTSVSLAHTFGEAYRWTPATGMVALGTLPSHPDRSAASGISADGSVIVGVSGHSSAGEAFRWTSAGGMVGLGQVDGASQSSASGVSADGSVIVGCADCSGLGSRAFVWTPSTGMTDLREYLIQNGAGCLDGWTLTRATAVSDDGNAIVGYGRNPDGKTEGWVAYLDGSIQPPIGERFCDPAALSSTGLAATLSVTGSSCARDNDVHLMAANMPALEFGLFLTSLDTDLVTPAGSQGNLCLGGNIVRFTDDIFQVSPSGSAALSLDLFLTPVTAGSTWHFQTWFRDRNPGPTSNLSDAVSVLFQ